MRDGCSARVRMAAAGLWLAIGGVSAFAAEMKYPDFESQWKNANTANGDAWDPAKARGLAQQAPLTPEYQTLLQASLDSQAGGGQGRDRSATCALNGMPRMMSLAKGGVEILISPSQTWMVFEQELPRRIFTDGRDFPDEAASFQGNSIGKWIDEDNDGRYDVLEIETRNFDGPRVLESTGLPLHEDNETVVKERIFLDKNNKDILHNEITTIDHAFTRPWTVTKNYVRQKDHQWAERDCAITTNHVILGTEEYAVENGKLAPLRKGQAAPDLRHFK